LVPVADVSEHLIQAHYVPPAFETYKYNPYYDVQADAGVTVLEADIVNASAAVFV